MTGSQLTVRICDVTRIDWGSAMLPRTQCMSDADLEDIQGICQTMYWATVL